MHKQPKNDTTQRIPLLKAFLDEKLPRDQALRAYPQLKPAFDAQDKLTTTMTRHQPLTRETQRDITAMIRGTVARDLIHGREPKATPRLENAVALHVAIRNLNTVESSLTTNPTHAPALPKQNRLTLIRHAEAALTRDPPATIQRAGDSSPQRFEASQVAQSLAKLDFARNNLTATREPTPFRHPKLAEIYKHEQAFQSHIKETIGRSPDQGRYESPYRYDAIRTERTTSFTQPVAGRGLEH